MNLEGEMGAVLGYFDCVLLLKVYLVPDEIFPLLYWSAKQYPPAWRESAKELPTAQMLVFSASEVYIPLNLSETEMEVPDILSATTFVLVPETYDTRTIPPPSAQLIASEDDSPNVTTLPHVT